MITIALLVLLTDGSSTWSRQVWEVVLSCLGLCAVLSVGAAVWLEVRNWRLAIESLARHLE